MHDEYMKPDGTLDVLPRNQLIDAVRDIAKRARLRQTKRDQLYQIANLVEQDGARLEGQERNLQSLMQHQQNIFNEERRELQAEISQLRATIVHQAREGASTHASVDDLRKRLKRYDTASGEQQGMAAGAALGATRIR